ncbi:MAG: hypothetical protein CMP20_09240 [Rickettsiales bacterium]|nr:hypothetical protein [Rickettsiales bacterium]
MSCFGFLRRRKSDNLLDDSQKPPPSYNDCDGLANETQVLLQELSQTIKNLHAEIDELKEAISTSLPETLPERREMAKQNVIKAYGRRFYKKNYLACKAYIEAFAIYEPGERHNTMAALERRYKSQAE